MGQPVHRPFQTRAYLQFRPEPSTANTSTDKILRGAGPSLSITVPMFFGELFSSISLALIIAFVRGSKWDFTAVMLCVIGMSIPYLSYIMFAQYFLGLQMGHFPCLLRPG